MKRGGRALAFIAALGAALPVYALDTPILSGGSNVPSTSATNFTFLGGNQLNWNATELNSRNVAPSAATLRQLYIQFDTAPGGSASYAFTVQKNGSDTALSCTISGTNTTCNNTADTVSLAAGDTFSLKSVPTSTPNSPTNMQIGLVYQTSGDAGALFGGSRSAGLSTTTTQYALLAGYNSPNATLNLRDAPSPVAGTIDWLYVELTGIPNTGAGYTFTVLKDGAAQSLVCSITNTNTTCNDTTNSVSVEADDLLSLQVSIHSGTPTSRIARWGLRWTPSTLGETIVLHNSGNSPNTGGSARWAPVSGASQGWSSTEAPIKMLLPGTFTWQKWRMQLNTAPGGSASYTFRSRKNAADGAQNIVIAGTATTGNDMSNSDSLTAGDLISAYSISANSPASAVTKWGWVFTDPNAAPTPTPTPTATATATATVTATATATATPIIEPGGSLGLLGIGS